MVLSSSTWTASGREQSIVTSMCVPESVQWASSSLSGQLLLPSFWDYLLLDYGILMDSAFHRDFLSFFIYVFHFFVQLHSPSYQTSNYCLESIHFKNSYTTDTLSLLSSQVCEGMLLSLCSPLFHLLPLLNAVVKFLLTDVIWPKTSHYSDWVS